MTQNLIKLYDHHSNAVVGHDKENQPSDVFLTLKTTGTEVHGIIPSSVITISIKSDGVTS